MWKEKVLDNLEARSDYLKEEYCALVMQIKLSFSSGHLHFVERSTARRIPHFDVCLLDISTGCLSSSYLTLTTPKTTLVSSLS